NALKFVPPGTQPQISLWTKLVGATEVGIRSQTLPFNRARYRAGPFGQDAEPIPSEMTTQQWVRIVVQDAGIGIAPEVHQKIFGIFERGTSSSQYQGTGIGLAI